MTSPGSRPIPHTVPPTWPANIPPTRFAAQCVRTTSPAGCRFALLGLPDDLGVRLNNGRPGAALGPPAFRAALAGYGVGDAMRDHADPQSVMVYDAGDVPPAPGDDAQALAQTHDRVSAAARAICDMGMLPIAIGGGHDLTYAFVRGVREHFGRETFEGVYFDAHLDVRDTVGSGMGFRRLIDECGVARLQVVGLNPLVNSAEHAQWFTSHGGVIVRDTIAPVRAPHRFVSFDMDVLDMAHAPGVSAMNPEGLSVREAHRSLVTTLDTRRVRCLDFMELSPPHDDRGRTARVAAHLFLVALRQLAMTAQASHAAGPGAS